MKEAKQRVRTCATLIHWTQIPCPTVYHLLFCLTPSIVATMLLWRISVHIDACPQQSAGQSEIYSSVNFGFICRIYLYAL